MKPDEIKSNLECCENWDCENCSYDGVTACSEYLRSEALNYINQLEAEKRNLEYTLLGVMHFVDKWLDENELEQDEVNRVDTMRHKTLQIIGKQQAKIEALKMDNEQLQSDIVNANGNCDKLQNDCELLKTALAQKIVSEIKSEALKEFAERFLKIVYDNHYPLISSSDGSGVGYGMFTIEIEQAVNEAKKEMVGENNGI